MINIRPATLDDYDELLILYGEFVCSSERYANKDGDSFKEFIKDKNSYIDLAEKEGEIIGFISYSVRTVVRYPKPICEVEEFYVKEEFRREKVGSKLMDRVINFAKHCHYIFLASGKEWKTGHKFYKSKDFEEYAYHYRREP